MASRSQMDLPDHARTHTHTHTHTDRRTDSLKHNAFSRIYSAQWPDKTATVVFATTLTNVDNTCLFHVDLGSSLHI